MTTRKTTYLVNNKKKEPTFAKSFAKVAKAHKTPLKSISSLDIAYSYDRATNATSLLLDGKRVEPTSTDWFIRAWAPSEDATALLALFLELHKANFTDAKVNAAHEIRTSKLSQTFQLGINGCACPSTWVVPLETFSKHQSRATKALGFPVVVKARGGLGQRVWKCDTKAALEKRIKSLKKEGADDLVILQEMIENVGDIRVVVFRNQVIASIERSSSDGFLNNVSQGGTARSINITAEEQRLAKRAAKAVNLELAGVDIVRSEHGPLVFEVNKAPDISSFDEAAGFDIAREIAERYFS